MTTLDTLSDMIAKMNAEINDNISNLRKDIDSKFTGITNEIKSDVNLLQEKNEILEAKFENLDRLAHLNDLLLYGVPFTLNEDLKDLFYQICDTIGFITMDFTLMSIFRAKTKNKQQTIVIKFISASFRNDFYIKYLKFKDLSLQHLGIDSNDRIFIKESLSKTNLDLFQKTLKTKLDGKIEKVFTRNGLVYIRRTASSDMERIYCLQQICEIESLPVVFKVFNKNELNHKRKPSSEVPEAELRSTGSKSNW